MPYTTNPNLPNVRMEAVRLVRKGWSTREVARHLGYSQSTIVKWGQRAQKLPSNARVIPTQSSRPNSHPKRISHELELAIVQYRLKHNRCAEVLHHLLARDGYEVSLSTVKRTLKRRGLTRYSKWKKWHQYPPRPKPEKPGVLLQVDTIHDGPHTDRLYIYTILDVCSRWAFAWPTERISTHHSLNFVRQAQGSATFSFQTIQSDHGPEFSKWLTKRIIEQGINHRHSRIRQPNDNAHVERFNRTIQEECIQRLPRKLASYKRGIRDYLEFYNNERPHMALDMQSPLKVIPSY